MTQKDDFDLQLFLPYLLNQAAEEASLSFQRIYKDRYGMLRTEWRVLFHLGMFGPLTATEIGTMARMHKTKISRAVARLEDRRMLTRTRLDSDRRHERLALTAQGQAAYADLRAEARAHDAALAARLTPDEARVIRGALLRLSGMQAGAGAAR